MALQSNISYLSPLESSRINNYTFTIGITYDDPGGNPQTIEVYRFISDPIYSESYIGYGFPIPLSFFEKIQEIVVTTGPGFTTFTNQIPADEEIRRDIFETHDRYVAYSISQELVVENMVRTEIQPDQSSSSVSSSTVSSSTTEANESSTSFQRSSESSISSSSIIDNIYGSTKKTTYLSNCKNQMAITNPMTGINTNVYFLGNFNISPPTNVTEHVEVGGLLRNNINKGVIYCPNANDLFYMKAGGISLTLSLPHNINNGIYDEIKNNTDSVLQDKLIWAVNMGEHYITQPGLYAALTPYGIEFTIWSSLSKSSIIDTSTTILANTDFDIDFVWNKKGVLKNIPSANMAIFVNGNLTSWGSCYIGNDNFDCIYKYFNGLKKHASFCLMGNRSGSLSLNGIIRRIETYTSKPFWENVSETSSSQTFDMKKSSVSIPLEFHGIKETLVKIKNITFNTVITKNIDLGLTQESGAFRNKFGEDMGSVLEPNNILPKQPIDLPPGFEIVRRT